jgi:hypothetical protein
LWPLRAGVDLKLLQGMLDRFGEIAHQVIPVGDLGGNRGTLVPAFGIKATSVPRNDFYSRVTSKPGSKARSRSNGKQIDDASLLQIHQHGPVLLALAPGPVVHPKDANLRVSLRRRALFNPT